MAASSVCSRGQWQSGPCQLRSHPRVSLCGADLRGVQVGCKVLDAWSIVTKQERCEKISTLFLYFALQRLLLTESGCEFIFQEAVKRYTSLPNARISLDEILRFENQVELT